MLNGLSPLLIFQFSKLKGGSLDLSEKIPLLAKIPTFVEQPPIPVYLDEGLTGLLVVTEDKNVDVQTDVQTSSEGSKAEITQKGIGSTVDIMLEAVKDSVGVTLLSALIDVVFDKVTSDEYAITYFHGATTIFRGKLTSYVVQQNSSDTKLSIRITLTRGEPTPKAEEKSISVPGSTGETPTLGG